MSHEQMSLPYEEITSVMGRTELRKNFSISSTEGYKVPLGSLTVRDGYNKRRVYEDMGNCVAWIKENIKDGVVELDPPPVVDFLPDGRVMILRGHRRLKAINMAVSQGEKIDFVVCRPSPKGMTEFDRVIDIYASNMNQSKLNAVEQADLCYDLKNNFGKISNEEIAKRIGVSRQQVDNLLILAGADDLTKQEIIKGNLNISEAIKSIRASKKAQEDADKKELDANKTSSSAASPEPDPLAEELKELKKLKESDTPTDEELQQRELQRIAKEEKEREEIMAISDEIKVRPETLPEHLGRKLSMPVMRIWVEDFIDEDNGEVVTIERSQVVIPKNEVVDDAIIETILEMGEAVDTIFVYQKWKEPVAKSVITVAPGEEDNDSVKYDMDRVEIQQIQNVIKNFDKMVSIVSKIDCCPEQTKTDLEKLAEWTQRDLAELRTWINKNKKQNKAR